MRDPYEPPDELPNPVISLAGHSEPVRGLGEMHAVLRQWLMKRGIEQEALRKRIHAGFAEAKALQLKKRKFRKETR